MKKLLIVKQTSEKAIIGNKLRPIKITYIEGKITIPFNLIELTKKIMGDVNLKVNSEACTVAIKWALKNAKQDDLHKKTIVSYNALNHMWMVQGNNAYLWYKSNIKSRIEWEAEDLKAESYGTSFKDGAIAKISKLDRLLSKGEIMKSTDLNALEQSDNTYWTDDRRYAAKQLIRLAELGNKKARKALGYPELSREEQLKANKKLRMLGLNGVKNNGKIKQDTDELDRLYKLYPEERANELTIKINAKITAGIKLSGKDRIHRANIIKIYNNVNKK